METIFAAATPIIKSGVAIIRISGSEAKNVLKIFTGKTNPVPRKAFLSVLNHPQDNTPIDSALVLWFPSPNSFTGEDVLEFHTHGSIAVIEQLLESLSKIEGCRLAEAGEFSRRAFYNGKMDLTEAEGLADLIEAETKLQARQAYVQSRGGLRLIYSDWRQKIINIRALIEAYIDFPDEEIPDETKNQVNTAVNELISSISNHLDDDGRGERLRKGLYATIIGPPNAGKSSLLNRLAKRDVAIVSDIAGTTRDAIEVSLDVSGYPITLTDTAGLRESSDEIESIGVGIAKERADKADINIILLDGTNIEQSIDSVSSYITESALVVINKIDISNQSQEFPENYLLISAETGEGLNRLIDELESKAKQYISLSESPVITRQRHRNLLSGSVNHLHKFDLSLPPEICAEDLRSASQSLASITGEIGTEDILDQLFGNFCIGK